MAGPGSLIATCADHVPEGAHAWHPAELAVAHWLQHTSRDGDMQPHVHSRIARVAKTGIDGK